MGFSFCKIFEQLLKEIDVKSLGVFPGKFKPPHRGHFKTCKKACSENDLVFILISQKEHENITAEQSFNIWNIYKKYLPNTFPFICTPTPVLGAYDFANIINNGEYSPQSNQLRPKSNIQDLIDNSRELESYINVGNSVNLNLYASEEDITRFKNIKKSPYMGKNILEINFKSVLRLTSASKFRKALTSQSDLTQFLPKELSKEDKNSVLNILNGNI